MARNRKRPISKATSITSDPRCPHPPPHDKSHAVQPNRCNLHDWAYDGWWRNFVEVISGEVA
jgi:hypothetical protein